MLSRFVAPALIVLSALATRLLSWHSVFQLDGVYLNGGDSYYHLRRIRYSVENFPAVLDFDPLMNAPQGAQPIWSPAFDWLVSAMLVPIPGILEGDRLERIVVWIGPILGAATVACLYAIGARFFSRRVGLLAAAALAIMPGHILYSRLANADHHGTVAWVSTLLLGITMRWFARGEVAAAEDRPASWGRSQLGPSVGVGLGLAAILLVWPGALIHVAVLQLGMLVRMLTAPTRAEAIGWAGGFAIAHGVAALAVFPVASGREWELWGSLSPVVLSDFQPLYLFVACLCFVAVRFAFRAEGAGASPGGRAVTAAGVGGLAIVGLLASIPELRDGLVDAASWLTKDDDFQALVNESQPLLGTANGADFAMAWLSGFVWLVPVAWPWLAWRDRRRPERLLLYGWALAFGLATLLQLRFVDTYSVAHALLVGLIVANLWDVAVPAGADLGRRVLAGLVLAVCGGLAFAPSARSLAPDVRNVVRAVRGESVQPLGTLRRDRFLVEASRFLRDRPPAPGGEAGSVLAPWAFGHLIKYVSGRAVVQDNFGNDVAPENFRRAAEYFAARSEAAALEAIAPTRARHIVVMPAGAGRPGRLPPAAHFWSLYDARPRGGEAGASAARPALERHRLVHQSAPFRPGGKRPLLRIFEIVPGATIVGQGDPGSFVDLSLRIEPAAGSAFDYRARARVDPDGRYAFRVPYANGTREDASNVAVEDAYRLEVGERTFPVRVTEDAVWRSLTVEGPDLRRAAAGLEARPAG